jgi:hypothetical protein
MDRLAAILALLLVIGGCAAKEQPVTHSADAQTCIGGFMAKRGLTPWPTCFIPFSDGGKSCSDKADCQGQCLLRYADSGALAVGSPASGQCQVATTFLCTD